MSSKQFNNIPILPKEIQYNIIHQLLNKHPWSGQFLLKYVNRYWYKSTNDIYRNPTIESYVSTFIFFPEYFARNSDFAECMVGYTSFDMALNGEVIYKEYCNNYSSNVMYDLLAFMIGNMFLCDWSVDKIYECLGRNKYFKDGLKRGVEFCNDVELYKKVMKGKYQSFNIGQYAALCGNLDILKFIGSKSKSFAFGTYLYSALFGNLDCLKYIFKSDGYRYKRKSSYSSLCTFCVINGQFECFNWAKQNDLLELDENFISNQAIKFNNLDFYKVYYSELPNYCMFTDLINPRQHYKFLEYYLDKHNGNIDKDEFRTIMDSDHSKCKKVLIDRNPEGIDILEFIKMELKNLNRYNNNMEIIDCILQSGDYIDTVAKYTYFYDNLNVLKYLCNKGYKIREEDLVESMNIKVSTSKCFNFCLNNGCNINQDAKDKLFEYSSYLVDVDILRLALKLNCKRDIDIYRKPLKVYHKKKSEVLEYIKFACINNINWTEKSIYYSTGYFDIFELALEYSDKRGENILEGCIKKRNLKTFKYALEHGCSYSNATLIKIAKKNELKFLKYLHEEKNIKFNCDLLFITDLNCFNYIIQNLESKENILEKLYETKSSYYKKEMFKMLIKYNYPGINEKNKNYSSIVETLQDY